MKKLLKNFAHSLLIKLQIPMLPRRALTHRKQTKQNMKTKKRQNKLKRIIGSLIWHRGFTLYKNAATQLHLSILNRTHPSRGDSNAPHAALNKEKI